MRGVGSRGLAVSGFSLHAVQLPEAEFVVNFVATWRRSENELLGILGRRGGRVSDLACRQVFIFRVKIFYLVSFVIPLFSSDKFFLSLCF